MMNRRILRTGRGPRKVIPDLWDSIMNWDEKTSGRLERIGIKNPSRKQTRSLLAQFINDTAEDAEIEPVKDPNAKRKRRSIFLVLKRK